MTRTQSPPRITVASAVRRVDRAWVACVLLFLTPGLAEAQVAPAAPASTSLVRPTLRAGIARGEIRLDGRLDEAA